VQSLTRRASTEFSALRHLGAEGWLPLLFGIWLLLAVLTPGEVYRAFFHALIYPLTIYLLVRKDKSAVWKDSFIRLFLLFCGYMAATTWLVSNGPADDDAQALRWGLEAALGMVAYFLWMRSVVNREREWGRWFLCLALVGSFAGLLSSFPEVLQGARIQGLGAMDHPIQGGSIATIFLATGLFLTFHERNTLSREGVILAIVSVVSVCTFVTMSQSRGPLISLAIYLLFFVVFASYQHRRPTTFYVLLLVAGGILGLIHWLFGLGELFDQLVSRGTSYRFDIWDAYLTYLPESLLLGNGAGLDFGLTDAARLYLEPIGIDVAHPHSIWIGAFVDTGLIGVFMQAGLVILPAMAVIRSRLKMTNKLHLLAILGLFLLLTFSDEYTLLISLHPIWFFGWVPLVFVWVWSRYRTEDNGPAISSSTPRGER